MASVGTDPRRRRGAEPRSLRADWTDLMPRGDAGFWRGTFAVAAAALDAVLILFAALAAGVAYHGLAFGERDLRDTYAQMGIFVALLFVFANVMRGEYAALNYLRFRGHGGRSIALWNLAFVGALAVAFLTKTTGDFSRGTAVLFYPLGFVLVLAGRCALAAYMRSRAARGRAPARRVLLVGLEKDISAFSDRYQPGPNGMRIVSAAVLRGGEDLRDDLALAAASARMLRPDDVFILAPWSDTDTIDACVNAFMRVPAAIHLGPERVLDRFVDARISKFGAIASLNLVGHALTPAAVLMKGAFDLALGLAALVALSPLMLALALAIKLESEGPVLFLQRRYGFNQEPFRIVKFRSMRVMEDGRAVPQARAGDPRITRVGRFMRRFNLDELPQLFNVLQGRMSLVGPRPHALAHDQLYETTIALYARRHNMKPGITGWAQVNGFRGETATAEAMRARVEHDLWYIDNWSLMLDLRILWLTVASPKAYRNAR